MGMLARARDALMGVKKENQPGSLLWGVPTMTGAGVPVSEDSAMRFAAVHACVRVLSEDVAALPLHVYKRTKGKDSMEGKERAKNHPLYRLLHDQPCPEMTAISFKSALMVNVLLTGNAYAYIEYDRAGRVIGLWPLMSTGVQPYRNNAGEIRYQVGSMDFGAYDIMHIPGLSFDGRVGLSPIAYARSSIGLGQAAEEFGAKFFGNGTHLGGVISVPGKLSDEAFDRTKVQFQQMYKGLQNSHGVPLLENGATFTSIGIAPEDAQFLETRKFQRTDIAAIYRVPLHLIGDLERATFSNIEHQDLAYLQRSLLPWLTRIEQAMTVRLLSEGERKTYLIEHDTGSFLRGDTLSRMQAYQAAIGSGIMTPNEARVKENMNPREGGDNILLPLNMAQAGQEATQTGSAAGAGTSAPKDKNAPYGASEREDERSARLLPFVRGAEPRVAMLSAHEQRDASDGLSAAFLLWLTHQGEDIRRMAERILSDGGGAAAAEDLLDQVREYYATEPMPADIGAGLTAARATGYTVAAADLGSEMPSVAWQERKTGFYLGDAWERITTKQRSEVERAVNSAVKADRDVLAAVEKKAGSWDERKADYYAEQEARKAEIHAQVSANRAAGYESIWVAPSAECEACRKLNGQVVTKLCPPLHGGCKCSVRRQEKTLLQQPESGILKMQTDIAANGIKGKLAESIVPYDMDDYSFNEEHINAERGHNVSHERALEFIRSAKVMLVRWNGRMLNFYSEDGAAYVDTKDRMIRTAYSRAEFDGNAEKILEVVRKHGKS